MKFCFVLLALFAFANAFYEVRRSIDKCFLSVSVDGEKRWLDISENYDGFFSAKGNNDENSKIQINQDTYITNFELIYSPCKMLSCKAFACLALNYHDATGAFSFGLIPIDEEYFKESGRVEFDDHKLTIDFKFNLIKILEANGYDNVFSQDRLEATHLDKYPVHPYLYASDSDQETSFEVKLDQLTTKGIVANIEYGLSSAKGEAVKDCPISASYRAIVGIFAIIFAIITLLL